jgi:hypothetical protein
VKNKQALIRTSSFRAKNDLARHAVTKPYAAGHGSKEIKINVFVCNNAKQLFLPVDILQK